METIVERFRLEDVQRSPAFFDVKKLAHINGVYIRALAVGAFVAAARPWVDPAPGRVGAGPLARPRHRRAGDRAPCHGRRSASTRPAFDGGGRGDPGAGGGAGRGARSWSTSSSSTDAPEDEDSWQKAVAGDELAPRDPGRARWRRTRTARGTWTRSTR